MNLLDFPDGTIIRAIINGKTVDLEYHVESGQFPALYIPRRELIVWENQLLRESLARGLAEAAVGETADLGSFAEFAADENEQD